MIRGTLQGGTPDKERVIHVSAVMNHRQPDTHPEYATDYGPKRQTTHRSHDTRRRHDFQTVTAMVGLKPSTQMVQIDRATPTTSFKEY